MASDCSGSGVPGRLFICLSSLTLSTVPPSQVLCFLSPPHWTPSIFSTCCALSCFWYIACVVPSFKKLFIYLATPGLNCSMWDLAPWWGIEPLPPALGGWGLSHWTPREVPVVPSDCSALYPLQLSDFKSSLMSQLKTHFPREAFPGCLLKQVRCSCCIFWGSRLSFPWRTSPFIASLNVCYLSLLPHCNVSQGSDCFNIVTQLLAECLK